MVDFEILCRSAVATRFAPEPRCSACRDPSALVLTLRLRIAVRQVSSLQLSSVETDAAPGAGADSNRERAGNEPAAVT